jgi:hypothetical protein
LLQLSKYEAEVNAREKAGEEKIRAVEEILKQTEEDADKVCQNFCYNFFMLMS